MWENSFLVLIGERVYLCGQIFIFPHGGGRYLGAEIAVFTLKGYTTPFKDIELHLVTPHCPAFNCINTFT